MLEVLFRGFLSPFKVLVTAEKEAIKLKDKETVTVLRRVSFCSCHSYMSLEKVATFLIMFFL